MLRFLSVFVSLPGIFVLAALDSTIFFTLPLGIDAAVVLLSARHAQFAWVVPCLATAGSIVGAALTYWLGATLKEAAVNHYISEARLERMERRLQGSAVTLAALDLVPPPFPFSMFVLAAGAAAIDRRRFFVTLALCRMLRFGAEALAGSLYGRKALSWLESDLVVRVAAIIVVLALAGSLLSLLKLLRSVRRRRPAPA
jgi:membrane protein YqaA with SNARE-associated domain